jgi:hypothetical protein
MSGNPMRSVPDWRITLRLAHASPRCGAHQGMRALPVTSDAEWVVPDARRGQHRPRTPEGLQRIVKARTVHGAYGAEMRELRRLVRAPNEEQRRVLELVK